MKRMLVNAIRDEELRIALVDDGKLFDLDIEKIGFAQKKANIYKGRISSLEPSLEAAFVDFGSERHGFLPLKEVDPAYFSKTPESPNERPNIQEVLNVGQEVIVQVEKDERGSKGAALTTFLTIAGAYLVLMPNNPRAGGISRRIEGEERESLKEILSQLDIPENMGVIVRTAGVNKTMEELAWDLDMLLNQWRAIQQAAEQQAAPFLIQQESDIVMRAVRDYLRHDIQEIVADNTEVYNKIDNYISRVKPDFQDNLRLYQNPIPIFNYYQIEHQIETAFLREVSLPAGGAIVIDQTEALVTIDINSARATKGGDIEETAFNTNLEAAEEIARQLRLRDIGGLIVVDFIDMNSFQHQREVENRLRDSLRLERARTQIGKISRFGLLEMSRQRLGTTLGEANQVICPRCNGRGTMRSVEATCTSLLRMVEEEAMKPYTAQVRLQVPVEIGTYLLNEKRRGIEEIQQRQNTHIVILPNPHYQQPHYKMKRIQQTEKTKKIDSSYKLIETPDVEPIEPDKGKQKPKQPEQPAVEHTLPAGSKHPSQQQPQQGKRQTQSLIKRLWESMFGSSSVDKNKTKAGTPRNRSQSGQSRQQNRSQPRRHSKSGAGKGSSGKPQQQKQRQGQGQGRSQRGSGSSQSKGSQRGGSSRGGSSRGGSRSSGSRQQGQQGQRKPQQRRGGGQKGGGSSSGGPTKGSSSKTET